MLVGAQPGGAPCRSGCRYGVAASDSRRSRPRCPKGNDTRTRVDDLLLAVLEKSRVPPEATNKTL